MIINCQFDFLHFILYFLLQTVGPPCKIDLYSPESVQEKGQKVLAYQSVIDSGLINFELFDNE